MRAHPSDRLDPNRKRRGTRWKKKRVGVLKKLNRKLGFSLLFLVVLSWLIVLPFRWIAPPTTAFMLQDNSNRKPLLYEWAAWTDISTGVQLAVVAAEDQKFASHFGFDLKSIKESVEDYSDGGSLRGASTITQQVAKNLYLWPGKNFLRKGVEAYFALLIEAMWPKKRILEIYLNIAELGPGIYGVGAASGVYFDKLPAQLTDSEAALVSAVLPNPKQLHIGSPSSYVRRRQSWIIGQMKRLRQENWLMALE